MQPVVDHITVAVGPAEQQEEVPPWAVGLTLDAAVAKLRELPPAAHTLPGYRFPPAHTADVYGRGDAGPTLTAEWSHWRVASLWLGSGRGGGDAGLR
eukprot:COSAG04_NODE_13827_length_591_cov_0.644309_1_plen_96_part_10